MREKIYCKKDKIIIEIPFWRKTKDIYGNIDIHPWLIGIINKTDDNKEMGFAEIISLPYKGDYQHTDIKYHFWGSEKEFRKICKKIGIDIIEEKGLTKYKKI